MSLDLLKAVLSSNHTKSATRLAQVILAFHACPTCERVYVSAQRLAAEMNIHVRNAQTLLRKLQEEECLRPTGEHGPKGVTVYRLSVTVKSSRMESSADDFVTSATVKSSRQCLFCTVKSPPNRQGFDRQEIEEPRRDCDEAEEAKPCRQGEGCGIRHQPGLCGINPWDLATS
jgi:hypothetical protein